MVAPRLLTWGGPALLLLAGLAGCQRGPRAPTLQSLQEGAVYKDEREGFRFFAPEGWKQSSRGFVPPGELKTEHMLVEYKCLTSRTPALLQVSVADVEESASLADYLLDHRVTREEMKLAAPPELFKINDVPAVRIRTDQPIDKAGKLVIIHETVAFRRGTRVYFFEGTYANSDTKSRREIKTAVDSIVW
jgi:hypothetical protein